MSRGATDDFGGGTASHATPLEQMPIQHRIAVGERPVRSVAAQAAGVHFQLGVEVVGVVDDQTFRHQRQPRRPPLRQTKVRQDDVFQHLHQFRVHVAQFAGRVAHQVAAEEQMAGHPARHRDRTAPYASSPNSSTRPMSCRIAPAATRSRFSGGFSSV